MTAVPWATLEPLQFERIAGILLCRRFPRAQRIQPAQGDGGLDVIVPNDDGTFDNYQLKYFHARLTDDQKKQCKKSLKRAIGTHAKPDEVDLATWYLTLPLDPTQRDLKWLDTIARNAGTPFPYAWRGLTFLDGLAAEFPDVIDYYLGDGQSHVANMTSQLRSILSLDESVKSHSLVKPDEVEGRLASLSSALNSADPHFDYEFQVGPNPPLMSARPGLIASASSHADGTYVTWHIFAKYDGATDDAPVTGALNLNPKVLSADALAAWEEHYTYGTGADLSGESVDVSLGLPGGLGYEGPMRMKVGPAVDERLPGGRSRWSIIAPDTHNVVAQVVVASQPATRGPLGGIRTPGSDTSDIIRFDLRLEPDGRTSSLKINLDSDTIPGRPIMQVARALRFVAEWHAPNRLAIAGEHDPVPDPQQGLDGDPQVPIWLVEYYEALASISNAARKPLKAAAFESLTEAQTRWIRLFGGLVDGTSYELAGDLTVQIPHGGAQPDEDGLMEDLDVALPMKVEYDGSTYELPPAVAHVDRCLASASEDQHGAEDGATLFDLRSPEGGQVKAVLRWPGDPDDTTLALLQR